MNPQDLIRSIMTALDNISSNGNQSPNQAVLTPVAVDNTDNTETGMMVPPLQQKMELLKKAVDVDSIYDEPESDCGCDSGAEDDEMTIMRRNAGINPVVMNIANDHEAE